MEINLFFIPHSISPISHSFFPSIMHAYHIELKWNRNFVSFKFSNQSNGNILMTYGGLPYLINKDSNILEVNGQSFFAEKQKGKLYQ